VHGLLRLGFWLEKAQQAPDWECHPHRPAFSYERHAPPVQYGTGVNFNPASLWQQHPMIGVYVYSISERKQGTQLPVGTGTRPVML
jgi:hypothetical protein